MALIATNVLGQNTPAIAATEAHYAEMWAQDATVMHGYAGASQAASTLTPLTPPAQTTNPAGVAGQAAAVAQATGASAGTHAQAMTSSLSNVQDAARWAVMVPQNGSYLFSLANSLNSLGRSLGSSTAAATGAATTVAPALGGLASSGAGGLSSLSGAGSAVSAGLGGAGTIGGALSVPQTWAAAAPTIGSGASALPTTGLGASSAIGAGNPGSMVGGMPMLAHAARAATPSGPMPRFDVRPAVVPRPVAAG